MKKTMKSKERVRRAVKFESPDIIPTDVWCLPATQLKYKDKLWQLFDRYPIDFGSGKVERISKLEGRYKTGIYKDEWGSVWRNETPGLIGQVIEFPLNDWSNLRHFKPPYETIEEEFKNLSPESLEKQEGFTLGGIGPIYHQMNWLRSSENVMIDLMLEDKKIITMMDMLHDFNIRRLRKILKLPYDEVAIPDDWGSQRQLLIPPILWRKLFKPRYKEYFDMAHRAGKLVFFHSDGYIAEIIEDMIEIGVDVLNSQVWCMNAEELRNKFRGRICFWGELDRQWLLPQGIPEDIDAAVAKSVSYFHTGNGGYICQCEFSPETPLSNIEAVFETWERYRNYTGMG